MILKSPTFKTNVGQLLIYDTDESSEYIMSKVHLQTDITKKKCDAGKNIMYCQHIA